MARSRTLTWALAFAVVFEGLRAGAGTFRVLIDLPARTAMGPAAFAAFSRATDLSPRGIAFYSVYGVGGFLVTAVAFGVAARAKACRAVQVALGLCCICSVLILAATTQAAPLMWAVGAKSHESVALASLLDRFAGWTVLRISLVDVSFLSVVAAAMLHGGAISAAAAARGRS
jgi:hypothetical protein